MSDPTVSTVSTVPAATVAASPLVPPARRRAERGQVLVIFAGAILLFMLLLAVVTDVSWYWANTLRVQRAADAAALAGAVYLPGNRTSAYALARAEARKNGYTDGTNAVVTPTQNALNNRQLDVTVTSNVGTYFMRVIGINSIAASRTSKAEYVLPVPMGSPQAYYGVGFFQGVTPANTSTTTVARDTGWIVPTSAPTGGQWTQSAGNITTAVGTEDSAYAYETTNGHQQAWSGFGLATTGGSSPITDPAANQVVTIQGIEVRLMNTRLSASCSNSNIAVDLSWNGGASWSTAVATPNLTTTSTADYTLPSSGGTTSTAAWGGRTWDRSDFTDANFRVRLTANKGCSTSTRQLRVDKLEVRVSYWVATTVTTPETLSVLSVANPSGGSLATQGFWGAVFTSGGVRENGDRYAPLYIGGNNPPDGTNGGPNPDYDPNGYDYTIEVGANGQVRLFDPVFCATGTSPSGGWLGTGDHWTTDGTGGGTTLGPVAVRFRLFNTNGTVYTTADDTQVGSDWTDDPGSRTRGDFSGNFSRASNPPQNNADSNRLDCSTHPAHNQWVLPGGWSNLPAGTYRLNVNTNLGQNATFGAENLFSIWVDGGSRARVYGGGRMAAYTNLDDTGAGGAQRFYFSQIEAVHAGKTMRVTLFDPGEASSDSYLRFLTPNGGSYNYARFDWSSNDGRSGTNVTQIQTASSSGALFNNRILTIEIPVPSTYGTGGLDPNGLGEDGWWIVEYDVRAGNDTTTWEVEIRGNPVHLKVP